MACPVQVFIVAIVVIIAIVTTVPWLIPVVFVVFIVLLLGSKGGADTRRTCFVAGARVVTDNGLGVSIETLKDGDSILCRDIEDNQDVEGRIERVDINEKERETVMVVLEKGISFQCSPSQRILIDSGEYVRAHNLEPGMYINGVEVISILDMPGVTVYSFVVKPHDNFLILVGDNIVVCHDNSTP